MNHLNAPTVRVVEVDTNPEPYKNAHIPGAVFWNIFTDLLLPDLRINLDPSAMEKLLARSGKMELNQHRMLHKLYTSHGITPDKQVFPYCAIGGRSAYTWFVLKYLLGYPHVRNYDGSWNEWSRLPDVPIER